MSVQRSTAVFLMALGGPDSLENVEPYLLDLRGGRPTRRSWWRRSGSGTGPPAGKFPGARHHPGAGRQAGSPPAGAGLRRPAPLAPVHRRSLGRRGRRRPRPGGRDLPGAPVLGHDRRQVPGEAGRGPRRRRRRRPPAVGGAVVGHPPRPGGRRSPTASTRRWRASRPASGRRCRCCSPPTASRSGSSTTATPTPTRCGPRWRRSSPGCRPGQPTAFAFQSQGRSPGAVARSRGGADPRRPGRRRRAAAW